MQSATAPDPPLGERDVAYKRPPWRSMMELQIGKPA